MRLGSVPKENTWSLREPHTKRNSEPTTWLPSTFSFWEFERLGSSRTLRSDARLIAATNRDLKEMVDQQKFRSDLYYRLNVFPIKVPALRDRKEDIPLLVRHFVQEFSRRNNRAINTIPSEAMEVLVRYSWPGNIRELQNVIERAVIISRGPMLTVAISELDADIAPKRSKRTETAGMAAARINAVASVGETSNNSRWLSRTVDRLIKSHIDSIRATVLSAYPGARCKLLSRSGRGNPSGPKDVAFGDQRAFSNIVRRSVSFGAEPAP